MNLSSNIHSDPDGFFNQTTQSPQVNGEQSLLVFQLDERSFALPIETVIQVIPMLKLSPVPQVKHMVEGIVNIHGQIVPVLSVRRHLGLSVVPPQLNTPIILIRTSERTIGLIVDEVKDVIQPPTGLISTPEEIMPDSIESLAILKGVAFVGGKAIFILDPGHLFNPTQVYLLNRAIESLLSNSLSTENAGTSDVRLNARKRLKNLGASLAEQVANLASDLAPVDGQICSGSTDERQDGNQKTETPNPYTGEGQV